MFRSPPVDAIVVLIIVLLILGPKRLPGIGRGLGQGMREFKDGITGQFKDDEDKPALSESPTMPQASPSSGEPAATPEAGAANGAGAAQGAGSGAGGSERSS
jgi:sec-independent protein translocase protein TatA